MNNLNLNILVNHACHFYDKNYTTRYHTWNHALTVFDSAKLLMQKELLEYNYAVYLAAYWHDAVYIPLAPIGVNEEASAATLSYVWKKNAISEDEHIMLDAVGLIKQTTLTDHLRTENLYFNLPLQILLDSDLSSLAIEYDIFCNNQDLIICENAAVPNKKTRKQCADFLSQFLKIRPHIYHTNTGQTLYEEKARNNIVRYIYEN